MQGQVDGELGECRAKWMEGQMGGEVGECRAKWMESLVSAGPSVWRLGG